MFYILERMRTHKNFLRVYEVKVSVQYSIPGFGGDFPKKTSSKIHFLKSLQNLTRWCWVHVDSLFAPPERFWHNCWTHREICKKGHFLPKFEVGKEILKGWQRLFPDFVFFCKKTQNFSTVTSNRHLGMRVGAFESSDHEVTFFFLF